MKKSKKTILTIFCSFLVLFCVLGGFYITFFCHKLPYTNYTFIKTENLTYQFDVAAAHYDKTGWAFHYLKTDRKDHFPCQEWIYYPSKDRSESFKIYKFSWIQRATDLVCADYSFKSFMPKVTKAYLITKDGKRRLNAVTDYSRYKMDITVNAKTQTTNLGSIPVYFYNFDWADLISMVPYLKKKHTNFCAGFVSLNNTMKVPYQGITKYNYMGQQVQNGTLCDVFDVIVYNLEDKEGKIFINSKNYDVVEINMELPDNPCFDSFKFTLLDKQQFTLEEWNKFILKKTQEVL